MQTVKNYLFQAEVLLKAAAAIATSDHETSAALLEMAIELVQKAEALDKPSPQVVTSRSA
jgi:hypothetical protein